MLSIRPSERGTSIQSNCQSAVVLPTIITYIAGLNPELRWQSCLRQAAGETAEVCGSRCCVTPLEEQSFQRRGLVAGGFLWCRKLQASLWPWFSKFSRTDLSTPHGREPASRGRRSPRQGLSVVKSFDNTSGRDIPDALWLWPLENAKLSGQHKARKKG